jgi:hypothetical protein
VIKLGKAREPLAFLLLINPGFGSGFFIDRLQALQHAQRRCIPANAITIDR